MDSQLESQCLEQESSEDHTNASGYKYGRHEQGHNMGVLVSGCQSSQISIDL